MSCDVGCRRGSNPAFLWLWHRPAAIAPIGPLAWEPLYATGVALKRQKKKKKFILFDNTSIDSYLASNKIFNNLR